MKENYEAFIQSLQTLAEKIRDAPSTSLNREGFPTVDKSLLHLEKNGMDAEGIYQNIAKILANSSVNLQDVNVTSETFLPLFALQLAFVLADSNSIDSSSKDVFMSQIHAVTSQWLSSIFNLFSTKAVTFYRSELESLRQVLQTALEHKYEALKVEGFPALFSRPPTIYISDQSHYPLLVESICGSLFIPKKNMRLVACEPHSTKMSISSLEELITEDIAEGKLPALIIARAGSHLTGEIDDLKAIRALCDKHSMWLHVEGNGVALLTLQKALPEPMSVLQSAESISVSPGRWLGLAAFPTITFYRSVAFAQLPRTHFPEVFLTWVFLQSVGQTLIASHVSQIIDTSRLLIAKLLEINHVRVLPKGSDSQNILFYYTCGSHRGEEPEVSSEQLKLENTITLYLLRTLREPGKHLGIEAVNFEGRTYLRFQFFSPNGSPKKENVEAFTVPLMEEVKLIESTLKAREGFKKAIEKEKDFQYVVPEEGWFGLGAVRCIPSYIRDDGHLSPEVEKDINELNDMVTDTLIQQDQNLYQKGYIAGTNHACVMVGVDRVPMTDENAINVAQKISAAAVQSEKSEKFIGSLAEVIKKGIVEAESDLQKESDQKLVDEGILKHIPIVGSFFSMFSTPEEPKKNAARSFNISKGKLDKVEIPVKTGQKSGNPDASPTASRKSSVYLSKERQVAIAAVEYACKICEKVRQTLVSDETLNKKDNSPVTVADYAAQAVINLAILDSFPSDPVVGEEDSKDLQSPQAAHLKAKVVESTNDILGTNYSEERLMEAIDHGKFAGGAKGRFWTLDPIDGTKGFLRGGQYAVCLALIIDGEVVLGVMGCPNLPHDLKNERGERGSIFIAIKGQGASQRPLRGGPETPIHVSSLDNPANAIFCESFEASHSSHDSDAEIAKVLQISQPPVRMDSQCKYGAIARGDASIYLRLPVNAEYEEKIWDHAAGSLLVKEAGGSVNDMNGDPLNFGLGRTLKANAGIVATNGKIHAQVLAVVKTVLSSHPSTTSSLPNSPSANSISENPQQPSPQQNQHQQSQQANTEETK